MDAYIGFILLGITINCILNFKILKKENIKTRENININILIIIGFVLGSKIFDMIVNIEYYYFYNLIQMMTSGYMFYGGVLGILLLVGLYCKYKGMYIYKVYKVIVPNVLILYAICKVGCFLNDCCSGINELPLQIIESIVCSAFYLIILAIKKNNGKLEIELCCIFFGIERLIAFSLREQISIENYIINQLISMVLIAIGIVNIVKGKVNKIDK